MHFNVAETIDLLMRVACLILVTALYAVTTSIIDVLQAKHDHNLRDPVTGDSPLMRACFNGQTDIVKYLLQSVKYMLFNSIHCR